MPLPEQLSALFDMLRYVRGEITSMKRDQIEFADELRAVRRAREEKEEQSFVNTTDKIHAIIEAVEAKKFNWGVWFRDKVLPYLAGAALLALLYIVFGGGMP